MAQHGKPELTVEDDIFEVNAMTGDTHLRRRLRNITVVFGMQDFKQKEAGFQAEKPQGAPCDSGIDKRNLHDVVLVGVSTRIPIPTKLLLLVQRCRLPFSQAKGLRRLQDLLLLDVTPLSILEVEARRR